MEWQSYHKRNRAITSFERRLTSDNLILFVCGSFGDIMGVLLLLRSFVAYHDLAITLLIDKKYVSLTRRFQQERVTFVLVESEQSLRILLQSSRERYALLPGEIYPTLPTLHPLVGEAVLSRRLTVVEGWRLVLRLPAKAKLYLPLLDPQNESALQSLSRNINSGNRRTLCFFIGSQSNTELPDQLLERVILSFLSIGYDVFINETGVYDQRLNHFRTMTVNFLRIDPAFLLEASELFTAVITPVSGVSALFSMIPHNSRVVIHRAELNTTKISGSDNFGYTLGSALDELEEDFISNAGVKEVMWPQDQSHWPQFVEDLKILLS